MIKFLRSFKTVESHLNSEKSALVTYRGSEFRVSSQNGHDDGPMPIHFVKPELICEQDKQLLESGHVPPIVSCVDRWLWSACCASTLPREGLQLGRVAHQVAGSLVVLVHLRPHHSNRQTDNLQ